MKQLLQQVAETPTLRDLEDWGIHQGKPLPRSTVSDVLAAKRPPSDRLLRNFLLACGVRDVSEIRKWLEARERVLAARPVSRVEHGRAGSRDVSAGQFFVEQDNVVDHQRWIQALDEELWMWGTTLSMHIAYLEPYIKQALSRKCQVKILLVTAEGSAIDMAAFRAGPENTSKEEQRERLEINHRILRRIAAPGLEIRSIDYLSPYTLYGWDPGLSHGRMCIRLSSFHGTYEMRPTFYLQRDRDEGWFEYFYEQFVSVWNLATPDS